MTREDARAQIKDMRRVIEPVVEVCAQMSHEAGHGKIEEVTGTQRSLVMHLAELSKQWAQTALLLEEELG